MQNDYTVVIPVFNEEKFVERALQSVMEQSLQPSEIVIVDDASTDNSLKLCEVFAKKDSRIKIVKHEVNKGIGAARKTGVENSTSTWISFLSADDYWHHTFLQKTHELIEKTVSDHPFIVYTGYMNVDEKGNKISDYKPVQYDSFEDFYIGTLSLARVDDMQINFSTITFPRHLANAMNFRDDLRFGEDIDWMLRMIIIFKIPFFLIPEPLAFYRRHSAQSTHEFITKIHDNNIQIFRKINEEAGRKVI